MPGRATCTVVTGWAQSTKPRACAPASRARRTMQHHGIMAATFEAPLCARIAAPLSQLNWKSARARQAQLVCAQLIDTPSPTHEQGNGIKQLAVGRRQQAAQALSIGVENQAPGHSVEASAAVGADPGGPAEGAAAAQQCRGLAPAAPGNQIPRAPWFGLSCIASWELFHGSVCVDIHATCPCSLLKRCCLSA